MNETLTDLAKETIGDMEAMDTDEIEEDTSPDVKRKRTLVVKNSKDFGRALKTLQQFVTERVDFCVYVVFQMVIDTYTKRQLYKADDDDTADVDKLFSDINIG